MLTKNLFALFLLFALFQTTATSLPAQEERLGFTVPGAPWTLTLPKDGFEIANQQLKPDGKHGYFMLTDPDRMLNVSFFIEPATKCKDSKSCRDMIWKAGNPSWEKPKNVVLSEIGDVSYFEFFMPSFRGMPVKQQNMYAQFVKDGFWVDLHISKVLYEPREHEMFVQLVKSIKFEPKK